MGRAQAYYLSLDAEEGNVQRDDRALIVNCVGLTALSQAFTTHSLSGREDFYLQYMVSGVMDVWLNGKQIIMEPGQSIVYFPHTEYHYAKRDAEEVQYYWAHFTGGEAEGLLGSCGIGNRAVMDIGIRESLIAAFEDMFQEFTIRDSCFTHLAASRLTAILVELGRRAGYTGSSPSRTDRRIRHSLVHIHQNYGQSLSIEALAELEHLSVSRFRSVFKARTGLSPQDYLTVLRVNHARQLMEQTDLPVGEIAEAVGYQDPLYFSRTFKKRTGLAPIEYKRRYNT